MSLPRHLPRTVAFAATALLLAGRLPAADADSADASGPTVHLDDYIVETSTATFDKKAPAVTQQVLGSDLKQLNLATTIGALRNLPNIFIRERFIGERFHLFWSATKAPDWHHLSLATAPAILL